MTPKTKSLIQLNAAVLVWGGTAMFAKGIPLSVGPIICARSLVAAVALWAFLRWSGLTPSLKRPRDYAALSVLGLLLALHWLTYFQALKVSSAAVAILSLHSYPVFTALIEPFLFGERLRVADVVLAFVVFVGIVVMTPEVSLSNSTTQGIALGVVSGLFFMSRNLLTRKYVRHYSSSVLMFWQVLVTGCLLLPVLALTTVDQFTSSTIGLLVLLGVVFTALPQTLFSASFQHLSAKTVGILATLLPFYGALFGYLIHNETVSARTAVGGGIILACIIFETARSIRQT